MVGKIWARANLLLPPIIWALLIFRFSSGDIPVASSIFWQDFAIKKVGHVLLFGVLALLIYRCFFGMGVSKNKAAIWAIILAFFYGVTDEYHQFFTQGREAKIRDIFIDGLGAGIFILLVYKILPKMPKEVVKLACKLQII